MKFKTDTSAKSKVEAKAKVDAKVTVNVNKTKTKEANANAIHRLHVMTLRYSQETWDRRKDFCPDLSVWTHRPPPRHVYLSPFLMSPQVPPGVRVFVVEMNNTRNKIEGIGLLRNTPELSEVTRAYRVYENRNYNRYLYTGTYYLDRATLLQLQPDLVARLDTILFRGYSHSKRGSGFTRIPAKLMTMAPPVQQEQEQEQEQEQDAVAPNKTDGDENRSSSSSNCIAQRIRAAFLSQFPMHAQDQKQQRNKNQNQNQE